MMLDNTLIVTEWMGALPRETIVVEVQPIEHAFGDEMSPAVAGAYDEAKRLVMEFATNPPSAHALPVAPFGGGWSSTAVWSVVR